MNNQTPPRSTSSMGSVISWKTIIRFIVTILLMLSILFLAAGRLDWWEAWAYAANALIVLLSSRALLILKNPDLALERLEAGQKENVKPWDKILMPLTALYLPLISWVVAGLDKRYAWSPDLPDTIQIIALVVIFLGSTIGTWAMLTNRFFSSHVRIQTDRGHIVVNSGPYRIVRHPGYAGGIISWIAAPVFFSSYWLIIPTLLAISGSILRTILEDGTLQEELPGYKEYARSVPYRLIPGIW
ncbi:MAG: isoprenylcysteine carboxylmethyltransferase family protein [Anaerolineales bacterium]|nr:isoprenylcysteine carboxylmethyltransferase family protein [Anaerolineales bacterium]